MASGEENRELAINLDTFIAPRELHFEALRFLVAFRPVDNAQIQILDEGYTRIMCQKRQLPDSTGKLLEACVTPNGDVIQHRFEAVCGSESDVPYTRTRPGN